MSDKTAKNIITGAQGPVDLGSAIELPAQATTGTALAGAPGTSSLGLIQSGVLEVVSVHGHEPYPNFGSSSAPAPVVFRRPETTTTWVETHSSGIPLIDAYGVPIDYTGQIRP